MTSGKYVAESECLEIKRGRKAEEENGEGADESVDGYMDGFGKLICIPWTPTVQSRYDSAFSKLVNSEILRGAGQEGRLQGRRSRGEAHAPALERRELFFFDLSESGVVEGTYERVFRDALAYQHRFKVADAAP